MKLSRIHSFLAIVSMFLVAGCNPSGESSDNKSNSDTTQNTPTDTTEGNGPSIGFVSVDFRSVPDDYYESSTNLLIGVAAEITDPDGYDDIVFAGFVYENEIGEKYRITLKDTRSITLVENQQDDFDTSLNLYYDTWFSYGDDNTKWNMQNIYFFAYDTDDNVVTKDYTISKPNGESLTNETFVYSPIAFTGDTSNGIAALTAPEISLLTYNSVDGTITLEFSGNDDRIRSTSVQFYFNDNTPVYTASSVSLLNATYDGTVQTYTFEEGDITLDTAQTNDVVLQARLLVTDDPDQEMPAYSNWWHYQSFSEKVVVTDL